MAGPFEVSFKVRGFAALDRALARLPDEVEDAISEAALREGGRVILAAAQANINSRSGRTAADLRMEVQVEPARQQGIAAIGGTRTGRTGRAHVLRWLEYGTGEHPIVAGRPGQRLARRAGRALRAIGERAASLELRRAIREGRVTFKRALKIPGFPLRASALHRGSRAFSPLTRALGENAEPALKAYKNEIWRGVVAYARRQPKGI